MVKKLNLLITLPILISALMIFVNAGFASADKPESSNQQCDIHQDLQGEFLGDFFHAKVWNTSENEGCVYDASLAMYEAPFDEDHPMFVGGQTLIGSNTVSVAAGETIEFNIHNEAGACQIQVDLVRGQVLKTPHYFNAISAKVLKFPCGKIEITPTLTPTTARKTAPTSLPSNTPTPGAGTSSSSSSSSSSPSTLSASSSTDGNSTSVGIVQPALASTGNSGMIAAIIVAGAFSVISGMILWRNRK